MPNYSRLRILTRQIITDMSEVFPALMPAEKPENTMEQEDVTIIKYMILYPGYRKDCGSLILMQDPEIQLCL